MKELIEKIDAFCAQWWWVIALALLVLLVILLVVVKVKNSRIRKLKQKNKALQTELETARTVSIRPRSQTEKPTATEPEQPQQPPVVTLRPQPVQPEPYVAADEGLQTENVAEAEYAATVDEPDDYGVVTDEEEEKAAAPTPTTASTSSTSSDAVKYTVLYDRAKETWIVKKDGQARVVRRVNTKEEAMQVVRELCRKNTNASLVVHKKDGKFQKH